MACSKDVRTPLTLYHISLYKYLVQIIFIWFIAAFDKPPSLFYVEVLWLSFITVFCYTNLKWLQVAIVSDVEQVAKI